MMIAIEEAVQLVTCIQSSRVLEPRGSEVDESAWSFHCRQGRQFRHHLGFTITALRYLRNESADNHGPVSNSCDTLRIILRTIKGIEDKQNLKRAYFAITVVYIL